MVKYYGRARQRTGAVNRIQPGLKMAGLRPKNGTLISSVRIQQNRQVVNVQVVLTDTSLLDVVKKIDINVSFTIISKHE